MVFGSVVINFRCAFLRYAEYFLLRNNISNFAEATREKRFRTMTPLGMSVCRLIFNEPRHEKTCLRGFRPGKTQTSLLSYRDKLES